MAPANISSGSVPHPAFEPVSAGDLVPDKSKKIDRRVVVAICILLAAMVWAVFGRTVHHAFVNFDDDVYVYKNPKVADGLSSQSIVWAFTQVHSSNWHPLTWLSHMLDCQLYGLNPGGHHLTNILLHSVTAILLFLVLLRMTSPREAALLQSACRSDTTTEFSPSPAAALWCSAFVAAVFAVHPLRVESVAWVAERKDLLSGLFFVLTIGAYVRYARQPFSLGRYSIVGLLLALALMSKPMVVTLPFVLLLLDYWPLQRMSGNRNPVAGENVTPSGSRALFARARPSPFSPRTSLSGLIIEKIPWLALCVAVCLITLLAQKDAMSSLPLPARIGNALVSYVAYLKQMFYPAGLAVFYPYPENGVVLWKIIAAATVLLAISIVAIAVRRKQPWLLVGWLWYLGMLVPAIGILQVGSQAQADRYTYLPQIGLYLALTWTVADWCAGWRRRRVLLGGLSAAVLVALIFCAHTQTAYWRNSESLWRRTLACTSDSLTAHINLGNVLLEEGRTDEAMIHYQKALQLRPDDAEAHVSFGYILTQKGKLDEAGAQFQKALELKPSHAEAHNDFGKLLAQQGKLDQAITHFQQALQARPDYAEACYNLGNALFQKGEMDQAMVHYQSALQLRPGYVEACYNLGNALFQKGKLDEAIARYQQALRIKPDYAKAGYNLATAFMQKGNVDEAIAQFEKVLTIAPDNAEAHYTLGTALLRKGKADQAIAHFQEALRIRPDFTEAQNDLAWELATCPQTSLRNGSKAVELAERASQFAGGKDPDILDTLAAAYAEAGRFDDAVRVAQKAIELVRAGGQLEQLAQLDSELKLYQAGHPFHLEGK